MQDDARSTGRASGRAATSAPRSTGSISPPPASTRSAGRSTRSGPYPLPTILRAPGRFRDAGLPPGDGAGARDARSRPALRDRRPPAGGRDGRSRGDGDLLAVVEHGVAPGRAEARRHDDLRCSRHRAAGASRIGCSPRQDQHRDPLSQRQRLQRHAARLCRSALPAPGAERRAQPRHQLSHRPQCCARAPSGPAGAALPSPSGSTASANIGRAKARSFPRRYSRMPGN